MRIRRVLQEYEAQLEPTESAAAAADSGPRQRGVEGICQRNAAVQGFDKRIKAVGQGRAPARGKRSQFAELVVRGGRARYRRQSERGEAVPEVEPKQMLQVSYGGPVILEGQFYSQ